MSTLINTSFNLSILECKAVMVPICTADNFDNVLIYPYWNVKGKFGYVLGLVLGSFNLSILECKANIYCGFNMPKSVLIYPYWNVKNGTFCK